MIETIAGSAVETSRTAPSLSRLMLTVPPSTESAPAKVAWLMPSRSATIEGTTDISASVEAMPVRMRSKPVFSRALASTSEVARASEPCMAASVTWTALSPPMARALRSPSTALAGPTVRKTTSDAVPASWRRAACSTAYSSSSESRPSTAPRSRVRSGANFHVAVGSGTYLTRTTIFMRVLPLSVGGLRHVQVRACRKQVPLA